MSELAGPRVEVEGMRWRRGVVVEDMVMVVAGGQKSRRMLEQAHAGGYTYPPEN